MTPDEMRHMLSAIAWRNDAAALLRRLKKTPDGNVVLALDSSEDGGLPPFREGRFLVLPRPVAIAAVQEMLKDADKVLKDAGAIDYADAEPTEEGDAT